MPTRTIFSSFTDGNSLIKDLSIESILHLLNDEWFREDRKEEWIIIFSSGIKKLGEKDNNPLKFSVDRLKKEALENLYKFRALLRPESHTLLLEVRSVEMDIESWT